MIWLVKMTNEFLLEQTLYRYFNKSGVNQKMIYPAYIQIFTNC